MNPKVASSQMQFDDPLQFWSIFVDAMNENPPPKAQITDMSCRSIGTSGSSSASHGIPRT